MDLGIEDKVAVVVGGGRGIGFATGLEIAAAGAKVVIADLDAANAQSAAERAIHYRQGVMKAQGWHMGNMGAQLKGAKPYNKEDFARSATFVSQLIAMSWDGF